MLHGFDVSAYQGNAVPPCDFVFVKATEGASYTSTRFDAQWASAAKNARLRGAYHFARPEQSSALAQADRLIAAAQPKAGDMLCLDLEASGLGQAGTNAWARLFGQRLRDQAPGIRTVLYMGSGYASNGTGKGLADFYDLWWYPQYPSTARTSAWPTSFSPWLPSGLTCGWSKPHIWQWTENFTGGLDANVSPLTIDQLAGGGGQDQEEEMPYGGQLPPGKGSEVEVSFPRGFPKAIGLVYDNSLSIPELGVEPQPTGQVRIAVHRKDGTHQIIEAEVGVGVADPKQKDKTFKTVEYFDRPADVDYVILIRRDDGKRPIGWDMS